MLLESSKEEITPAILYRGIGKFDSVFSIIFHNKSELTKELGPYINAILVYSKKDREAYEKNQDNFINNSSKGIIKIKILNPALNVKQKLKYELDGIKCSEIYKILYSPFPYDNLIEERDIKEVPNVIRIPYESKNKYDYENMFLGLYSRLINQGEQLVYDEKIEYIGIDSALHNVKTSSNLLNKLNLSIEEVQNNSIFWTSYYGTKEKISFLTEFEKKDLQNHKDAIWYKKLNLFFQELLQGGKIIEDEFLKEKIDLIFKEIEKFKTSRFDFGNPVIYWDLESYLHIILRHIKETKISEANKPKTEIPYIISDLKSLIDKILDLLEEEIERHFKVNKGKKFFRSGNRAVYFNRD